MENNRKSDFHATTKKELDEKASSRAESVETTWRKNLRIYYIINNLSTLCVFALLSKCLYSLYPSITATILFVTSYTFATVVSISSIYFSPESKSSVTLNSLTKYQLVEYFKNTPLCYLTFYYFTRLSCLKSTNTFDYNLLLLSTVYFSLQTVINCILTEIRPSSLLPIRFTSILFLFLFRYFAFLAKTISSVLLFSTLTDPNFVAVLRSSSDLDNLELFLAKNIYLLTVIFLIVLFIFFFAWYLIKYNNESHRHDHLFCAAFESYKMLIEYNVRLLDTKMSRVLFQCGQFLLHLIAAYFWYYRAVIVLAKARTKTTILGLLTKQNHLRILVDLYELEEKLKTRQFELVCVLGSILISYLAQYIYFAYYEIDNSDGLAAETNKMVLSPATRRRLHQLRGRYVSNRGRPSVFQVESARDSHQQHDTFSTLHSCKRSSSDSSWIASSASTSSSSGIFNLNNNYTHKQMDCSTCCTSIDR